MYFLLIGPYRYLSDPTKNVRTPYTLVSAMRDAYGCADAHVYRADGTLVVAHAGRASSPLTHAPTGRKITRRTARHLRTAGVR